MPKSRVPGPRRGKKYRVDVTIEENKLRFTDASGANAERIEIQSSDEKTYKSVLWMFNIPKITSALIEFAHRTPFFDRRNEYYIEMVRDKGKKSIELKVKSIDWAQDDCRAIGDGEEFKYDVVVEAGEATWKVDPIVIVRGT